MSAHPMHERQHRADALTLPEQAKTARAPADKMPHKLYRAHKSVNKFHIALVISIELTT
jgi:hypothetical protein